MASLADYVEQVRTWVEEVPVAEKPDPVLQEEIVDKITRSIRQTAATGSHFSKMLSPEEEEIMREIIREFMNAEYKHIPVYLRKYRNVHKDIPE